MRPGARARWETAAPCASLRLALISPMTLHACTDAARDSALVTHTHPEGVAGTIAVAVAAAMAWQLRDAPQADNAQRFFTEILRLTPESKVRRALGPNGSALGWTTQN